MMRVTIDGESYACPFASLFRPHTAAERARMIASVRTHGIQTPVLHYLSPTHGRAVLDGVNRALYGLELDTEVPTLCLGTLPDDRARALALSLNRDRRHLTLDEQTDDRNARIRRVAAAASAGTPYRTIAHAEGVALAQVQRDIKDVDRVPPDTPPPPRKRRRPKPHTQRAVDYADQLARSVGAILKSTQAVQLRTLAHFAGDSWPELREVRRAMLEVRRQLDTVKPALGEVRRVLRDLNNPAASA